MDGIDEFSPHPTADKYGWRYIRMFDSGIKWIFVLLSLALIPSVGTVLLIRFVRFISDPQLTSPIDELSRDSPMLILGYWGGIFGALAGLVNDQLVERKAIKYLPVIVGKLYLGGMVGALSFFSVRSAVVIKLLYPNLNLSSIPPEQLVSYNATFFVAVISGILAPSVVKGLRRRTPDI